MRLGLGEVDVAPSPNVQLQPVTVPSGSKLRSVKVQVKPLQLEVKSAAGSWFAGGSSSASVPNRTIAAGEGTLSAVRMKTM